MLARKVLFALLADSAASLAEASSAVRASTLVFQLQVERLQRVSGYADFFRTAGLLGCEFLHLNHALPKNLNGFGHLPDLIIPVQIVYVGFQVAIRQFPHVVCH